MIHIDGFEIQDVETGHFLTMRYLGNAGPSRYAPLWVEDIMRMNTRSREASVDRFLSSIGGQPDRDRVLWHVRMPLMLAYSYGIEGWSAADPGFREMFVRKVRRPCCECCGANREGLDRSMRPVGKVEDGTWRCEKHVGRNPCAIEGCGKTTKGERPSSTDYLCGTHWRMAPRRLKLRDRKIWRAAKRRGWDDQLVRLYWRNWRCLLARTRLIVHPPKVDLEILPSSGPPPAALVAELQRIGL